MNRKITRRALGGKCGGRGASGSDVRVGCAAEVERFSRSASARNPNPPAERRSQSRRVNVGLNWLHVLFLMKYLAARHDLAEKPIPPAQAIVQCLRRTDQ